MRKYLTLLFVVFTLSFCSCKSKITAVNGAKTDQSLSTQLSELRGLLPNTEIKRITRGIKIVFDAELLFENNSSVLKEKTRSNIKYLVDVLNRYPQSTVIVEGHTDITGTTEYNKDLSDKRALSVKEYAVSLGVSAVRVRTIGYGETRPVATNSTPVGQAKNRRVEIIIVPNDI